MGPDSGDFENNSNPKSNEITDSEMARQLDQQIQDELKPKES